jgi:hypothetical protein
MALLRHASERRCKHPMSPLEEPLPHPCPAPTAVPGAMHQDKSRHPLSPRSRSVDNMNGRASNSCGASSGMSMAALRPIIGRSLTFALTRKRTFVHVGGECPKLGGKQPGGLGSQTYYSCRCGRRLGRSRGPCVTMFPVERRPLRSLLPFRPKARPLAQECADKPVQPYRSARRRHLAGPD